MPKVKIVLCQEVSGYDDYMHTVVRDGLTDWEEVSDADLALLKQNLHRIVRVGYSYSPILVIQDEVPVVERIDSIKESIAEYEVQQAKERQLREKKKKEREQKQREKNLAKVLASEEAERELLKQLKEKYPEQ